MTENIPQSPELDFDAWLAGGERTHHFVPLYTRFDLIADIEELEKSLVPYAAPSEDDESLGGEHNPNAEIEQKIDELNAKIYASMREFRVQAITENEHDEIKEQVNAELSDEIDAAAKQGRDEARKTAKRVGITAVNDINALVRVGANEMVTNLITYEVFLRKIAKAATIRYNDAWLPLTTDQVRALHESLGDAQIRMLSDAALSASNDVPVVTVPKS